MKRRQEGTESEGEGSEAAGRAKKLSKRAGAQLLGQDNPPRTNEVRSDIMTVEEAPSVSASTSAQCRTEILKTRAELETGIEKLMALAQKGAEYEILTEKISQLERDLVRETETSRELRIKVQHLNQTLRKERIQNYFRRTAEKTPTSLLTAEEKVLHLFPNVLKIIIEKNRKANNNSMLGKNLRSLLTSCRLVCKSWKQSVDLIMQQDSFLVDLGSKTRSRSFYKECYTLLPLQISYDYVDFDDIEWTGKLKVISSELQRNPSYNPIPSRHLVVSTERNADFNSENWANYSKTIKRFLQLVGEQVWHLTVRFEGSTYCYGDSQVHVAFYKCLLEWFSLVPNLRSLALYTWITAVRPERWNEQLGKMILPKFKNLVTFEGFLDTHLNCTILNKNNHVKQLGLFQRGFNNTAPSPGLVEIDLPNLMTFECKFYDVNEWTKFADVTKWKLEDMCVRFYGCGDARPTPKQFAKGVSKLGRTLKSLRFKFCEIQNGTGEKLELNLPQLKSLYLTTTDLEGLHLEPLLLSLTGLETFSLEVSLFVIVSSGKICCLPEDDEALLDYVNHFRDKVDWMKLPKLQSVNIIVETVANPMQEAFVVRRENMPSVKFSVVKFREYF